MSSALFAEINTLGGGAHFALKKAIKRPVHDPDPSTNPAAAPTPKPSAPAPTKEALEKAPVLEFKGKNWTVEYQNDGQHCDILRLPDAHHIFQSCYSCGRNHRHKIGHSPLRMTPIPSLIRLHSEFNH